MKLSVAILILTLGGLTPWTSAQDGAPAARARSFDDASRSIEEKYEASVAELEALRERVTNETLPLSERLNELEKELLEVRLLNTDTLRELNRSNLDVSGLTKEIETREAELSYLRNQLTSYISKFKTVLHVTERSRYDAALQEAELAPENAALSELEILQTQSKMIALSLDRLFAALGGERFEGKALDANGRLRNGTVVLVGPTALFGAEDGTSVGTAEQLGNSPDPNAIAFANPGDMENARAVLRDGQGLYPLDPTLGNAHKIAAVKETVLEHLKKGGLVIYPIVALAALALLIALYRFVDLTFTARKPARRKLRALLEAVAKNDRGEAAAKARKVGGATGRMLTVGVEHMDEPRALLEEIMYETVLTTRLKLNKLLPFIAICAAAAPLLGLLGTVTGIIKTFERITIFGSGDVKLLSGGISEALITTECGLIVAIPSLLLHAFLSRRARGAVDEMEKAAIAFMNVVEKSRPAPSSPTPHIESPGPDRGREDGAVDPQIRAARADLLAPALRSDAGRQPDPDVVTTA